MHTYVIHATLLALCYSNMFRTSKGHLQAVRLMHFDSQLNKICAPDVQFSLLSTVTSHSGRGMKFAIAILGTRASSG